MAAVPAIRIRAANAAPVARDGAYVLYWMIAARRTRWNFALDRAVEWAVELNKPLVVFEPLRCDYRWASDRLHRFVIEGMADNERGLAGTGAVYYPYVEPAVGKGRGLLSALASRAGVIVTDEFPCFFLPQMVAAAAGKLAIRLEAVDANGMLPLRASDDVFTTAHSFRRYLQKHLREHLSTRPTARPLGRIARAPAGLLDGQITRKWSRADLERLLSADSGLKTLPIDHGVVPAPFQGGQDTASRVLRRFVQQRLDAYPELRNVPDEDAASGLSPYLHFGHISTHEVFARLARHERWTPKALAAKASGSRSGWWGMSEGAEAFLDQLITWRELGFNYCAHRDDYDRYESLPAWARKTLEKHARDKRPRLYEPEQLEAAATHDPLWNAAQNQLVRDGRLHNYLRMLWGKKILEWSRSPREALDTMIALNDKYAVDGRDPNSYSGIGWVLGKYDRAWGPERPIFGTVRYMTSENTARKVSVKEYLARYAE